MDLQVYNGDYEVPIRVFFPDEASCLEKDQIKGRKIMLFLHGGGWATEHVENYERVCSRMAQATGQTVAAVEYRLAPEHKFPTGLMDCYAVARALYTHPDTKPEDITLIGDSAGGNLAAALSIMARDRGEFMPKRQILIYPAVNNDYSEKSLFSSVRENGQDYLLTAGKLKDYINLYAGSEEDKLNPYFAPILEKDLSGQPDTLILTSEFDHSGMREKRMEDVLQRQVTGWKYTGSRMHFTDILHWESGVCMYRKVLNISIIFWRGNRKCRRQM